MAGLALEELTAEQVAALPEEYLEALKPYERLLASNLLEAGDIGGWARGLKIRTPNGVIQIEPYWYQEKLWAAGKKERFRILLKARQIGITEAIVIEMLAYAKMIPDSLQLFVSARQEVANDALTKVKDINRREGPAGLKLVGDTKISAEFANGSRIFSLPANENAVLSYAATRVYLDEFAHMPWAEQIYEQIFPTISHDGFLTIVSTPRGQSGKFYETWMGAKSGQNNFWARKIHWAECPAYNPKGWNVRQRLDWRIHVGKQDTWYKTMRPQYSDVEWARQYECDFVASADLFFSDTCIQWLRGHIREPKSTEKVGSGELYVYEEPRAHAKYIIAGDSATGLATGDWSVAMVVDIDRCEEVALLRGHWPPAEFAHRINGLRNRYDGLVVVERNGSGIAVLDKLEELDSRKLYYGEDKRLGWHTTVKSRPRMMSAIEEALRTRSLKIRSREFLEEALTFVRNEVGIPAAARGRHDDLIMAAAMAWRVRSESPREEMAVTPWAERFGFEENRTGY